MAGEKENLSKTLNGSDHIEERIIASETLVSTSASASGSSPDDQPMDIDFLIQYEVEQDKERRSRATLDMIFKDFRARRSGIIKALTVEVQEFCKLWDPAEVNLCLYGNPDETWEVSFLDNDGPPDIPEPPVGLASARIHMDENEWLALVAMHSDAWLLALTFYLWARFSNQEESRKYRKELFSMVDTLPTIYEVVNEYGKMAEKERISGKRDEPSSKLHNSRRPLKSAPKVAPKRPVGPRSFLSGWGRLVWTDRIRL